MIGDIIAIAYHWQFYLVYFLLELGLLKMFFRNSLKQKNLFANYSE